MARSMNMRWFYAAFGVLVVAGAAWIWSSRSGAAAVEVGPEPVTPTSFPGWVLGSDSAPVEIVEYADFECGACAHFAILTAPDLRKRLVATGRVRMRFRDFPIQGHQYSPIAHEAGACAGEQGRFWEMADQIFFHQTTWVREGKPAKAFEDYAKQLGLNTDQYQSCMKERRHAGDIEASRQAGLQIGVSATPSFVIGGLLVTGALPYDSIVRLVERAEARARQ
jgi:protein-disulfide isomerase